LRYRIICLALASLVLVALFYTSALEAQEQQYVFVDEWDLEPGSGAIVTDQRGPYGIALDGSDNVYVTDRYNRCFIVIPSPALTCSNIWRVEKFTSDGNYSTDFDWEWQPGVYGIEFEVTPHPSGMAVDHLGYIYVADPFNERIKKFSSRGGLLREWGSPGDGNGQFYGLQDLAVDSQGNVYATDTFNNRIQKFNSNGVFLAKWTSSRLYMPRGIAVDRSGNVYVTDTEVNRVLKFSPNGALLAEWGSGVGLYAPFGIDVDNQGNVYVADTYNNRIVKFSPNGALLANWGREGDGRGEFVNPEGVAVDSQGYVYVADTGNLRIQKFMPEAPLRDTITLTSGILNEVEINPSDPTIVVPEGARISGSLNITVQNGQIADVLFPVGATPTWGDREDSYWTIVRHSNPGSKKYTVKIDLMAPTSAGQYYIIMACAAQPDVGYIMSCTDAGFDREVWYDGNDVVDWDENTIQDAIDDGYVSVPWFASKGSYENRDTGAAAVRVSVESVKPLDKPTGVAVDVLGYVYVADTYNHRIRKFAPNGEPVNTWGTQGDGDGQFRFPRDVAVDRVGNVYVVDKDNHRVQKFSSEGGFLWKWGEQGSGNAQFNFPRSIAADYRGYVYVADSENHRVQKFSPDGSLLAKWGTRGSQEGQFWLPCGIATDSSGNVYVADTDNNRIQKFNSDGKFLTAYGTAGSGDLQFNDPCGVDVDEQGNVYVADTFNHRIQAFTPEGALFYKQGVRGDGNGQFNSPYGIAVDEASETHVFVYVADTENDRIQKFLVAVPAGYTIVATAGEHGTISPAGEVMVEPGAYATFEIVPDPCYYISRLLVDNEPVDPAPTYTFREVTSNHTIEAVFEANTYTIKSAAGLNGTIFPSGVVRVTCGEDQKFIITPDPCYRIARLLVDNALVAPATEYTFENVTSNHTIEASFVMTDYTITAIAGPNGTITPSGDVQVKCGSSQTFTMTPVTGYYLSELLVDGTQVKPADTYTFTNVTSNHIIEARFAIKAYTITAIAGVNGSISPPGSTRVNHGGSATFIITPNPCYQIAAVLVDNEPVDPAPEYTFQNVTSNRTIQAIFAVNEYIITASAGPNGTILPPGDVRVRCGSDQKFTMIPATGYHLSELLVDGTQVKPEATYTFTNVTSNHSIEARFSIDTYAITAIAGNNGSISPPGTQVNHGGSATFTITPDPCYQVAAVLVDNEPVGALPEYTFQNVTSNRTIQATFAINTYIIRASAGPNGTITPSGDVKVICGSDQEFIMTPATGYHLSELLVDGTQVEPVSPYRFTNVTSNRTIEARFAINTYTITATAGANGSISPPSRQVNHGGSATFTITPNPCYQVAAVLVDNEPVGALPEYTFQNVTSNRTIQATFTLNILTIRSSSEGSGGISPFGDVNVPCGSSRAFTITPAIGYHIADVLVDGRSVGTEPTYTFTNVTSDHTIRARFELNQYIVTASAGDHGSISPAGDVQVSSAESLIFRITPDPCYHVLDVLVDGRSVGAVETHTFSNVTSDHSIAALFAISNYTIRSSAEANGSISPSGNVNVICGSDQGFTIAPAEGYHVLDVLVDGSSVGATTTYTFANVTSDHTIRARFGLTQYTISASAGDHGSISPPGEVGVSHGASQTFTITPDDCYRVANVLVNNQSVGPVTEYTFENVTSDQSIMATFEAATYVVTAIAGTGGSISPSGAVTVNCGASQTFAITSDPCYTIADVLVNNDSVGAVTEYTFENVRSNQTIRAVFETISYTITASADLGGNISPSGEVIVNCGSSQTFTIAPANCYRVADCLVNNQSVGPVTEYTFENVTADQTIRAMFEVATYTINASAEAGGSITPSGGVTVSCGSSQTFIITADNCYNVADVMVNNQSVGPVTEYTFPDVTSDQTIRATFELATYTIDASAGAGGSISPSGGVIVNCRSSQRFTITPDPCYRIAGVLADNESAGTVTEYTYDSVFSDHTIRAVFEINTYTITATAGTNGRISPPGVTTVNCGSSQTYTIAPSQGYTVSNVLVDGRSLGSMETYAFTNVSSNHTISVSFRVADDVPPTGSITIDNNAQYTNNRTVNLRLSASDNSGVVSQMQFSNDNVNYSSWETYATTSQWQLTAGDGRKTVYVRFRDGAGNQSTARSDSITLDTTPPTGRISINNGDEYTSNVAVSLTMSMTDSGSGLAQMRFSNNNTSFSSPENYSSTTTWNLTSGDGVKTVYARFQDGAGNWTTATISDNITLDTEPPEVVTIPETQNVPVNAPIQISFSEEIDEGSIDIRVSGSISGNISGRTTYSNGELTFVPDRNFSDREEVTVEVIARDLADNRISFSVGFSTAFGVWPGDTNNDSIVNILDLLPVGQYWNERGDRRSPADTSWEVQHATPWENEGATYVDADGNGVVDERDLEVIKQNWGETQPTTAAPPVVTTEDLEKLERLAPDKGLYQYLDAASESPGIEQLEAYLFMLLNPAKPKQIPVYSSLGQNYPNPFNPDTWIPYQLAKGSDVTIEIYSLSGQLVRTISLGYKNAGVYITKQKAAYWDGSSNFGEPVSSGIYFYTIKAGSFTNTRKLIVVR
jgi:streptogramin lyase